MNPASVTCKTLIGGVIIPKRHSDGAAGYDIYTLEKGVIPSKLYGSIKTGFTLTIPYQILGLIMGRSGLALKHGLEVKCSYVKNDEEVKITIYNNGEKDYHYESHERIAQLVFLKMAGTECGLEDLVNIP